MLIALTECRNSSSSQSFRIKDDFLALRFLTNVESLITAADEVGDRNYAGGLRMGGLLAPSPPIF